MSKVYTLSERDYRRIQDALRKIERMSERNTVRRRNTSAGEGSDPHLAYVAIAPAEGSSTVECYLDTDDPASEQITVYCTIAGGSSLVLGWPHLSVGQAIIVNRIKGEWWCPTTFQTICQA